MGNEAYAPPHELVEGFYQAAKRVSPDALVIDTDGCCVKYVSPSIHWSRRLLRTFAARSRSHRGVDRPNCDGSCTKEKTVDGSSCDRSTNDYMVAHMGYCDLITDPNK